MYVDDIMDLITQSQLEPAVFASDHSPSDQAESEGSEFIYSSIDMH